MSLLEIKNLHASVDGHEILKGIDLTPRCKVLRTIAGELGRIQSHLLCVGAAGLDLGAFTAFLYGFNERELIYDIVEFMSGQRFHRRHTFSQFLLFSIDDKQKIGEPIV